MTEYDKGFIDGLVAVSICINECVEKGYDSNTIINVIRKDYTDESND